MSQEPRKNTVSFPCILMKFNVHMKRKKILIGPRREVVPQTDKRYITHANIQ